MTPEAFLELEAETRRAQPLAEEWIRVLLSGVDVHLSYGRYAEAERLARRALARCSQPQEQGYLNCLRSLALVYRAQRRSEELEQLLSSHPELGLEPVTAVAPNLKQPLESRLCELARPEPFPLPEHTPYPATPDEVAGWARQLRNSSQAEEVAPLLEQVKLWRQSSVQLTWLGSVGDSSAYHVDVEIEAPRRTPSWLSLEIAGCGYGTVGLAQSTCTLLRDGQVAGSPAPGRQRVFLTGKDQLPKVGTLALLRVGFESGPPLQTMVRSQ